MARLFSPFPFLFLFYQQAGTAMCSTPATPYTAPFNTKFEEDLVLVQTPSRNYTASMIPDLLQDVGLTSRVPLYRNMSAIPDMAENLSPGVDSFVAYGWGLDTKIGAVFSKDFKGRGGVLPDYHIPDSYITEPGDGVVPLRSAAAAELWRPALQGLGKELTLWAAAGLSHSGPAWQNATDRPVVNEMYEAVFEWIGRT